MFRLPLTGTRMFDLHNGHHACGNRTHGALSQVAKPPGLPLGVTHSTFNARHYHYSGLASVTAAVWKYVSAGVTLRLLGSLNELYTMTPMRLKNA